MGHRRMALSFAVGAALACNGTHPVRGVAAPSSIEILEGDGQTAVVGQELATGLTVRVLAADTTPVPGQLVSFRIVEGGGAAYAGYAITDSSGVARDRWTLGTTAGTQRLEARVVDPATGDALRPATFTATAVPDVPASLVARAGDGQTGQQYLQLPIACEVHVADRYGNAVQGAQVAFSPGAESGTASPGFALTDAAGDVRVSWTLGRRLGPQTLVASASGVQQLVLQATATAGPIASQLLLVSGDGQAGIVASALAQPIVVRLLALDGEPRAGEAIRFDPQNGGTATPPLAFTDTDGVASTVWVLGSVATAAAGLQRMTASASDPVSTLAVPALTLSAVAEAGAPAVVSLASGYDGQTQYAHFWVDERVHVEDAYLNVVPGAAVGWAVATGGGSVAALGSTTTSASGDADARWMLGGDPGEQTLEASVAGLPALIIHANARASDPFDGIYFVSVAEGTSGSGSSCRPVSSQSANGVIVLWVRGSRFTGTGPYERNEYGYTIGGTIQPSGAASFQIVMGHYATDSYVGQFQSDPAALGGASASGTYGPGCTGTWSAYRW